ncbi:MAG TPA: hypothetical protein VG963_12090, partial [Polyangiaceae bacterium]|nr:hypothetical protein [Polyangiaceae bacterium]
MTRRMRGWFGAVALLVGLSACKANTDPAKQDPVTRGLTAIGGIAAAESIKTLVFKDRIKQWEPGQSFVAGGEPRFANESTLTRHMDFIEGVSRNDWDRKYVYPASRTFDYSEIVTRTAGYVLGIDSMSRTKASLDSNPPAYSMSGLRLAATQRENGRDSPLLLFQMSNNRDAITPVQDISLNGVVYPSVQYKQGDYT